MSDVVGKLRVHIDYGWLGGFTLEKPLADSERKEALDKMEITTSLMSEKKPMGVMTFSRDKTEFELFRVQLSGSRELPDPSIFKRHMDEYKSNGWRFLEGSEDGFFSFSPRFKRAIKPSIREKLSDIWSKKNERT